MAVRQIEPIDRAKLRATIQKWIDAHTDVDDTDGVGLLEDVLWEINAQPTLTPPNEWLSVEERLPDEELNQIKRLFPGENEVEVLVMIEGAYIATTLYWDGEKFYDETSTYEVTHWMPLPAPPKKERDHE